jgi:hypothetical protein
MSPQRQNIRLFEECIQTVCLLEVFKGTVSRDGYIFEGLNIFIRSVCVCADGSQGLHYPK